MRKLEWDAAHRVMRHESKCSTLHGHRYVAEVTCSADALDSVGRVVDFGVIKTLVGGWIDRHWDHTTILCADDRALIGFLCEEERSGKRAPYVMKSEPTAECMAAELLAQARLLLRDFPITVDQVLVWETPGCYAVAR